MNKPTPPAMPGLPLVGNALEFAKDPTGLFQRGYESLGPIFTINLARTKAVVLIGPDNHQYFFENTDRVLSMREVYRFLIPMFGKDIFFVAGPEAYKEQRNMMLPAFSGRKMPGYIQVMAKETNAWLDTLGDEGRFDLVSSFETLTMYIAAAAFLGEDFRRRLGSEFAQLYRQLGEGIEFLLPTNLPLPRFKRRDRAKAKLEEMIHAVIAERRGEPGTHQDFLQVFIDSRYSDGSLPPQEVISSLILGLVFAGHETTAGHASWGLIQLLQHPAYLDTVLEEIQAVLQGEGELGLETVRRMQRLEWALKETERTQPVAEMLMRYNAEPYELCGYHIPEGWLSVISPAVSHRLPEIFSEPDKYDPERFAPGREEHRAHPYSLAGFGGGRHKCLGMNFAYHEMQVIFSLLLQRFHLELVDPHPKRDLKANTSRPVRPCWVRYRRR
jgi:sterol 14alpha-demethylase